MKLFIYFFIPFLLFNCSTDKDNPLELGFLALRLTKGTVSGYATKGNIKNAKVDVYKLGDDGSCSSNLLSTTTTDNSGFYSSPFYRTGGVLCVKISPIPGGNTTVYDETLKKDINLTSSSSLNLTHIVNESTLTENKRGGIFISPISQILNKRVQALLKQNPGANLANATKKASKEIVIRFGLNQGLGQRNFNTKSSLSDESYPELDQLNFSTINPSDPISKKFLGILAGFSKMANNYKTGSSTGPDDLDAIINAFASDMEDGLFDGKDSSGASVTIGSTGKALGADALTNQLLPALKEFINSGGVLGTGTTSVSIDSSLLNTIQFQDSTTIISNIDLSSTATITAPTSIAYSASSFTLTQGTLTNIVPTISGTPTTCTSSPSLPSGLILNPITCAISGSPLIVQTATNYIITASNSGGSISTTISITTNSNTVFSGATPFSLDTRYGDFEFNGNFYFKIRVSSTDYLVKIKNDGSIDSTFGTSGKLATPVNSTHFLSCGNKIFGIAATGGNYNIYKFNDTGAGSFSLSVTSSGVTTGNGLHQMYCIDSSIYYTVIDNGVPATGTGLMKFNTVSENFDIQFKNYSNAQIYHVMKDSTNQLWIYRSTSPQVSKIDASLNLVAGGEKTISMSGSLYYNSSTDMTYIKRADTTDTTVIYSGSVDDFLTDISDGSLNGSNTHSLVIHETGKNKSSSGIVASKYGTKILIMDYYLNVSPYEFATSYYDLSTNSKISSFNSGNILTLTYSPYNNFNGRVNAHVTYALGNFYFIYVNATGVMSIEKFL